MQGFYARLRPVVKGKPFEAMGGRWHSATGSQNGQSPCVVLGDKRQEESCLNRRGFVRKGKSASWDTAPDGRDHRAAGLS
jgi:hypothetical protein